MERRMMIGIKQLAEGASRERALNHVHVLLWTLTFLGFLFAAVRAVRGVAWTRSFPAFVLAAITFQLLTFAQPSILVGATLVLGIVCLLFWPGRARASRLKSAATPPATARAPTAPPRSPTISRVDR
jgi:hypothetical protein